MLSQRPRAAELPPRHRSQRGPAGRAREAEASLDLYRRAVSREITRREIAKFGAELAALGAELQTLAEPREPRCAGVPRSTRLH